MGAHCLVKELIEIKEKKKTGNFLKRITCIIIQENLSGNLAVQVQGSIG